MQWKDRLTLGVLVVAVLFAAWGFLGRQTAPAVGVIPAPATLPAGIARLLEDLSPDAKEAYAFALERPDVLKHMACYCGCVDVGHTSNLSCFIRQEGDGITLDSHGAT